MYQSRITLAVIIIVSAEMRATTVIQLNDCVGCRVDGKSIQLNGDLLSGGTGEGEVVDIISRDEGQIGNHITQQDWLGIRHRVVRLIPISLDKGEVRATGGRSTTIDDRSTTCRHCNRTGPGIGRCLDPDTGRRIGDDGCCLPIKGDTGVLHASSFDDDRGVDWTRVG